MKTFITTFETLLAEPENQVSEVIFSAVVNNP
jgi:hypothetical protein